MKHKPAVTGQAKEMTDQEHRDLMRKDPWYGALGGGFRRELWENPPDKLPCRITILPDQHELWRAWIANAPIDASAAKHASALVRIGLRAWAKEKGLL